MGQEVNKDNDKNENEEKCNNINKENKEEEMRLYSNKSSSKSEDSEEKSESESENSEKEEEKKEDNKENKKEEKKNNEQSSNESNKDKSEEKSSNSSSEEKKSASKDNSSEEKKTVSKDNNSEEKKTVSKDNKSNEKEKNIKNSVSKDNKSNEKDKDSSKNNTNEEDNESNDNSNEEEKSISQDNNSKEENKRVSKDNSSKKEKKNLQSLPKNNKNNEEKKSLFKNNKINEKEESLPKINNNENNNKDKHNLDIKNNKNKENDNSNLPTIRKYNMNKSSSTGNFGLNKNNKNNISHLNFKAGEIRINDVFEKSKNTCCYKCGMSNFDESSSITFSCNHISCFKCIIKDLMILQFKNIENKNKLKFNCSCFAGCSPEIDFSEFLQKLKQVNNKKEERHYCQQHNNIGIKYCKECEIWLCDECISIHSIFNKNHSLYNNEIAQKHMCKSHINNYTEYYCLQCNEEICSLCLNKIGKHSLHKTIKFEKFKNLSEEVKLKLKYKTYDECLQNLEKIQEKNKSENKKNTQKIQEIMNNLINTIKTIQENYIKEVNNQFNYLNKTIDIIKECYKYFYLILSDEKFDYNNLNFIRQISEVTDIKTNYYNFNDILKANNMIQNFNLNNKLFSYEIKTNEIPFQFSFNFKKRVKNKKTRVNSSEPNSLTAQSKYKLNPIKLKEVKYEKSIKTGIGSIYAIVKINNNEIAAACGNEILIINDISKSTNETNNIFYSYPSLKGHSKNVLCLSLLSENILASGGEDQYIKIWNTMKKECLSTIKGKYKRIDSLLAYRNNILIVGVYNIIKIINIQTKEEISALIGHTKGICSIVKISDNILASSSYDNLIKIWNINNQTCEYTLYGHDSPVFCILLLKDGRLVSGSGSWNKSIKIWNLSQKKCEFILVGHKREVRDIKQISHSFIISASVDKTIRIWNIYKKICVQTLVSHYDVIYSICIIDKNRFVSGGRDQDIIVWKC